MRTLLLLLTAVSLCAAPQGKGKGKGKGQGPDRPATAVAVSVYRIPQNDLVIVRDYYKGQSLPPGLAQKLARGGSLPPGWQKKIGPLPVVLERRLAPLPGGFRRGIFDGAFVVYDSGGVIVDIVASF